MSAPRETRIQDLFAIEKIKTGEYVARLWFEAKWAFLTEKEVEWLINELLSALVLRNQEEREG